VSPADSSDHLRRRRSGSCYYPGRVRQIDESAIRKA
jgi:hypothetical protein